MAYRFPEFRRYLDRVEFELLFKARSRGIPDVPVVVEDVSCFFCFCQHLFGGFYESSFV